MDPISDEELLKALTQACDDAAKVELHDLADVASALRRQAASPDDPLRALIAALEYDLITQADRRRTGAPFGPMMEMRGNVYPAPIDKIDPAVFPLWERALSVTPLALVRARLADLMWEARHGEAPHKLAQAAIDHYVDAAAGPFGHRLARADGLLRALELALQLSDVERLEHVRTAAVQLASDALENEEPQPGVSLRLIDAMARLRPDRRPTELNELVDRALERYGADPWNLQSTVEIKARLTPPEGREVLWRRAVEGFALRARKEAGVVKYAHLQHAIEIAELHGLTREADALRRQVEELPEDELGLEVVSTEVEIPREELEEFIETIVGNDDLQSGLSRFGSYIPIASPDESRAFVRQLMADHPLQYLMTNMVIGPENALLRKVGDAEAQEEQALLDYEARAATFFAQIAVATLARLADRYGELSAAAGWFEHGLIEPPVAERIGVALRHYESEDPDSAAAVLAPRLERIVRHAASGLGLSVTRSPDRQGRSGGVRGLGELLSLLEGRLPEPTRRYLRVVLTEVTGLNIRNRVGHGLMDHVPYHEAALLIHVACHLRLIEPVEATPEQSPA